MKTINIFAIILIVSLVQSTKKLTTFDDIVHSFAQIKDPSTEGLAKINEISESFETSNNILVGIKAQVDANCAALDAGAQGFIDAINKKKEEINDLISNTQQENTTLEGEIKKNIEDQKAEVKKINDAKQNIKKGQEDLATKESELAETLNVLHRLKNLAYDELAGTVKATTNMGNFTVVNNHGVSFIQRGNFKEELKAVMKKTETTAKALISTLILMTGFDDAHYSDPEKVNKILGLLDKIINSNKLKLQNLNTEYNNDVQEYSQIISNSANLIENLKGGAIKGQFNIEGNNKTILMANRDLEFLNKAIQRRQKSLQFHKSICVKQQAIMNANAQHHLKAQQRINAIRSEMA